MKAWLSVSQHLSININEWLDFLNVGAPDDHGGRVLRVLAGRHRVARQRARARHDVSYSS